MDLFCEGVSRRVHAFTPNRGVVACLFRQEREAQSTGKARRRSQIYNRRGSLRTQYETERGSARGGTRYATNRSSCVHVPYKDAGGHALFDVCDNHQHTDTWSISEIRIEARPSASQSAGISVAMPNLMAWHSWMCPKCSVAHIRRRTHVWPLGKLRPPRAHPHRCITTYLFEATVSEMVRYLVNRERQRATQLGECRCVGVIKLSGFGRILF